MKPHSLRRVLTASAILAVIALGVYEQARRAKAEEPEPAATSESPDEKGAEPKGPCDQLAAKLCKEAGEQSATCKGAEGSFRLLSETACSAGLTDFAATQAKLKEQAKDCETLIDALCAGVGPDTKSCAMVREQTKKFPPEKCTELLSQQEQIIDSLKREEAKNRPLDAELQAAISAEGAPAFGPADSTVTLVEFSDFECPYCSKAASVTTQLKAAYGEKVRFVFRQFPLSFHKNAQGAAEASMAANAQGKFWEFHDLVFKNQRALSEAELEGYAQQVGLNMAQFKADMASHKYADQVKADIALGSKVSVSGTPTLFINGSRVANPTDFDLVKKEIDAALGG
jgi:protein-disulfide isomerase